MNVIEVIAQETGLKIEQIKGAVKLLDEGNTIPFITRYRKEVTGSLNEEQLRDIEDRLTYLRHLETRKEEILQKIKEQGKLTPELEAQIKDATKLKILEDIYLPFRPKRRTRAVIAKEKGLEPFAEWILQCSSGNPLEEAIKYVNAEKEVNDAQSALDGAKDIIAETVSEDIRVREIVRKETKEYGIIVSKKSSVAVEGEEEYTDYFDYNEPVLKVPPHRVLALDRGESVSVLRVKIDVSTDIILPQIGKLYVKDTTSPSSPSILDAIADSYKRLIAPAITREIRAELTEMAKSHAIEIFAKNLRNLLLQHPIKEMCVLAIDPGFVSGCKIAVLSELGDLLYYGVIYPHPPKSWWDKSKQELLTLIEKHKVELIAIGNGTASRETEDLVSEMIGESKGKLAYVIVNEAGASVYSASKEARDEFPDLDASYRGTISIGRRLQDPLAELVKIDPKSLGVGLYQHDINVNSLEKALTTVVESCVNYVGVDLNRASVDLLSYVSGINKRIANNIVNKRRELGRFSDRNELLKVSGIGQEVYTQAAGFLRIYGGSNPLDITPIHPESYVACEKLFGIIGSTKETLLNEDSLVVFRYKLSQINPRQISNKLDVGLPTMQDIFECLKRPGRDPREDFPPPLFKKGIMKLEDLEPGMVLKGTVRNVVDFGAFIDIGLKDDGLVHISQMSKKFVKDPLEVCKVGDVVDVKVIQVDQKRRRVSLTMVIG